MRCASSRLAAVSCGFVALVLGSACSGSDDTSAAAGGGASLGGFGNAGSVATGGSAQGGSDVAQGGAAAGANAAGANTLGGSAAGGSAAGGSGTGPGASGAGGSNGGSSGQNGAGGRTNQAGSGGASNAGASGNATSGAGTSGSAEGGAVGSGGKSAGGAGSNGGVAGTRGGAGGVAGVSTSGGSAGSGGNAGSGGGNCPFTGHVSYTLSKSANPTSAEQNAYELITAAMDKATQYYNCYTNITKSISASYVPSVATADGNINGSLRFGSNTTYMDYRTAMHEISHTVGVGQASNWGSFISNGLFTGTSANAELQAINATLQSPADSKVHADTQHFWPYGINQQSEVKSEADLINHCKMVMAIRKDLGLR